MSFRSAATAFAAVVVSGFLLAALPGSGITSAGTTADSCGAAQTLFSAQVCNVPTLSTGSDEFDSSSSSSSWTVVTNNGISAVSTSTFAPYSYAGTTDLYSFSGYRSGWLMAQVKGGNSAGTRNAIGFYRDITPTSAMTVYAQMTMQGQMGNNATDGNIRLMLTDSSTTVIDSLVGAGCAYNYRGQTIDAFTNTGSVTQSYNTASQAVFPRYDNLYLHLSGTGVWCWAGTDDGINTYFATTTKTLTYTRLWVIIYSGDSSGGQGFPITGLNYVRFVSNQRFLP